METKHILDNLYPGATPRRRRRRWLSRISARLKRSSWYLAVGLVLSVAWLIAHLYYYNRLVDMEYNVQEAWAQVETQFQRRFHIQQNLTQMVLEYAKHERELMVRLTKLRVRQQGAGAAAAGAKPTFKTKTKSPIPKLESLESLEAVKRQLDKMSPRQLNDLFPHIQFMAEQYPKLRLSENFQQFSKATIDTENKIAEQIKVYNQAVNHYTTVLMQFPGLVFGKVCGFEPYEFYVPDRNKLSYRPVELKGRPRGEGKR